MRVSVVVGPGHHGDAVIGALRRRHVLARSIRAWPKFVVEDGSGRTLRALPWYDALVRRSWAAWRRIPRWKTHEHPADVFYRLFDRLASAELGPSDLFVGWAHVCLRSLSRARELGAVTLLEHPITHVRAFMRFNEAEYARWGDGRSGRYSHLLPRQVRRLERECAQADYISVLSTFARKTFLDEGVAASRLRLIPIGIDTSRFERIKPRVGGPFRVLCVGRLELLKGVPYLLEAFRELPQKDAELCLVGAVLPEMTALLARLGDPRVRVIGHVEPDDLAAHYAQASVVVFPSINDAFGLVILEAMASGVPVIATDRSGGPDILREGVDGFVVPACDSGAIAERLGRLADHPDQAKAMGQAARERVRSAFTLAHYEDRLLATYAALVHGRGGRTSGTSNATSAVDGPVGQR